MKEIIINAIKIIIGLFIFSLIWVNVESDGWDL